MESLLMIDKVFVANHHIAERKRGIIENKLSCDFKKRFFLKTVTVSPLLKLLHQQELEILWKWFQKFPCHEKRYLILMDFNNLL
jgi:hypothetical protein